MNRRWAALMFPIGTIACLTLLGPRAARAQAGAKPAEIAAEPVRTPDGQPDVQGFFRVQPHPYLSVTLERLAGLGDLGVSAPGAGANSEEDAKGAVVDPPDGRIPYQPWARAKKEEVFRN